MFHLKPDCRQASCAYKRNKQKGELLFAPTNLTHWRAQFEIVPTGPKTKRADA
ncbi:MAG: hypothetical protein WC614_03640 [bacterium]